MQKGADCPLLHLVCIYDYITVLQFCVGFLLELPSNFCGDFLLESSKVHTMGRLGELPQSKPDGFDSSLWEGAFGMAGRFRAKAQSLRVCPLPLGGAVAQRLRGCKSAEPEKTVKRSSRRTGVNLQFFPVQPTSLGLKGASSPFFVDPARRNRWHFSGSLLVSKENIPRRAPIIPKSAPHFQWKCGALAFVSFMLPAETVPQRTGRQ